MSIFIKGLLYINIKNYIFENGSIFYKVII